MTVTLEQRAHSSRCFTGPTSTTFALDVVCTLQLPAIVPVDVLRSTGVRVWDLLNLVGCDCRSTVVIAFCCCVVCRRLPQAGTRPHWTRPLLAGDCTATSGAQVNGLCMSKAWLLSSSVCARVWGITHATIQQACHCDELIVCGSCTTHHCTKTALIKRSSAAELFDACVIWLPRRQQPHFQHGYPPGRSNMGQQNIGRLRGGRRLQPGKRAEAMLHRHRLSEDQSSQQRQSNIFRQTRSSGRYIPDCCDGRCNHRRHRRLSFCPA